MSAPPAALFSTTRSKINVGLGLGCLTATAYLFGSVPPWKGAAAKALKNHRAFEVEEYTQVGLWYGVLALAVLLLMLLLTQRWWTRWSARDVAPTSKSTIPSGRWQWIGLVCALVLAAAMRLPLVNQGILWDEHDNLRRNFHGFTAMDAKPDDAPWHPAGYREAFFENARANNPFLYSVLAHASLDAWRAMTGAPRDRFNVVAMRLPAILFGLFAIGSVWGLGRRIGGPWVGTAAALLCALHPLHIRYSVEARGYSAVLWLAPLLLSLCWDVVRNGRWRDAFGVSFVAAGLLYAFPGGLYFVAVTSVALALTLLLLDRTAANRATLVRLVVAGSLAVGVLTILMLPGAMQARVTLDSQLQKNGLAAPWFAQTWSWMTVGIHNPLDEEYYTLRDGQLAWLDWWKLYFGRSPITFLVSLVMIPLLLVAGSRALCRQGRAGQMLVFISLTAPALCLIHNGLVTHYSIFQWYMIYALPPLVVIASLGLVESLGVLRTPNLWWPRLAWAGLLGAYITATYPPVGHRQDSYTPWLEDRGLPTAHTTFTRGSNTWVTYQDGRVLRLGKIQSSK